MLSARVTEHRIFTTRVLYEPRKSCHTTSLIRKFNCSFNYIDIMTCPDVNRRDSMVQASNNNNNNLG